MDQEIMKILSTGQGPAIIAGAFIGVIAVLCGALANGILLYFNDRIGWKRSRTDAHKRKIEDAMKVFAAKSSACAHSITWICWVAKESPSHITKEEIARHNYQMNDKLSELVSSVTGVFSIDGAAKDPVVDLARRIYDLDTSVAKSGLKVEEDHNMCVSELSSFYDKALEMEIALPDLVVEIGHILDPKSNSKERHDTSASKNKRKKPKPDKFSQE